MDFRILGPVEVLSDGGALDLGGQKQRAVLALLLVEANRVVSSDRLIDALWEEEPPGTALKALQVYVSQLRKLLGKERLETKAPGYLLRVEPEELDLGRFRRLQQEGRLEEALALWRGPPLADFAYQRFAQGEIARLEELRLSCLEERIERDLGGGRHAELVGELEALVKEQPLRERPRAQLMLALYRSGRQVEALAAYRAARRALVEELGIEPSRELKELERRILEQDPKLDAGTAPVRDEPAVASAPSRRDGLVGRERELTELLPVVEATLAGQGALILVGGEPGIGKSRLAEVLAAHARGKGGRVLVGRCWEAGGAPAYWPWLQALRSHLREAEPELVRAQLGRGAAELATILPELRELVPELSIAEPAGSEGARFRLFEAVADLLRNVAASLPLAVFFDDLHAADASSLLLLRFVAGQLAGAPLLLVGCYRDTEVDADLAQALAELGREPVAHRLTLKGLDRAETARLLETTMGRTPPEPLTERVHGETGGNPLFAAEIGRLLASEGAGALGAGADERLPMPEGVQEAITRRLERQSEACREVLALASVVGREFGLEALERVSGLKQEQLFDALEEAAAARLVAEVPGAGGRLRFSHVLVRDALYDALPPTRRLRLHRELGEALEALYARNVEPHLAELAHHYREAGSLAIDKAIRYAEGAGALSATQHAYEEAARQYATALRLLETSGAGDANRTCELLLALGEALSRAGETHAAKEALRRAAAIAAETGRSDQLARAASEYGGRFAWERASSDPGLVPLLERALAAVADKDDRARARLLARLCAARRDDAPREHRVALADEAIALARRSGDPAAMLHALEGYWIGAEGPDLTVPGDDVVERVISLAERIGDKERLYAAHEHRFNRMWMLGDRAAVDVELATLERLADELRQPPQRWHLGSCRTMLALMEGRFDGADELMSETVSLGRRTQTWNAAVSHKLALFVLRRQQGRLAEVEATMQRAVHEYPALMRFACALGHLYAELGREREARAVLDELMARDLSREHVDAEWTFSMCLLAAPCALLEDRGAVATLYSLLEPYARQYAVAPVESTFGSVAGWLGRLATSLSRFEDAEQHFEVAIETERRMGARPWLAQAQDDYARMLLARDGAGDRERALELIGEAVGTYRELGMESWAKGTSELKRALQVTPAPGR
jgi:DNA-binding SARP family transcriptional activator/tetratricopeptide (TPR) repeat protein